MEKRLVYRPEIDGLRSVAVVSVVLFHAASKFIPGGYIGVDVFFVISGFLITNIIVSEIESGSFSFLNFYERRARRILPALFFVIMSCLPFAWFYLDPFALKEFGQSLFATSLFSSNVYFFLKTGYFNVAADLKPLLHTWSLAVEEQYYIIYPIILIFAFRLGRNWPVFMTGILFVLSLALAEWSSTRAPSAAFYLLHTRAWELMLGALAAFYLKTPRHHAKAINQVGSFLGIALIALALVAFDDETPFPGIFGLVPTVGALLIILFAVEGTFVGRILSSRPFVFVGLISYSVYLWHQPIFAFYRNIFLQDIDEVGLIYCLILIFLLSYISYRWVEQPFRHKPQSAEQRVVFGSACVAGLLAFALVGASGHAAMGFPERSPQFMRLGQNYGLSPDCSGAELTDQQCMSGPDPRILLWGDSYAMHLGAALDTLDERELHQMTLSACPPLLGYGDAKLKSMTSCVDYNNRVFSYLKQLPDRDRKTVFLASGQNMAKPEVAGLLLNTLRQVRALGFKVVLVSPTPQHNRTSSCIRLALRDKQSLRRCDFALSATVNATAFAALASIAERAGVGYLDLSDMFCVNGRCKVEAEDGKLLYRDRGHMALESVPTLASFLRARGLATVR